MKVDWLNLHRSTLDSEAVVGSEPVDRATWLFLLHYCCGQENGGVLRGAKQWGDRRWQQLCRVTREEVMRETALWSWDRDDLRVHAYPVDKETEVRAKRAGGAAGAKARWDGSANGSAINNPDAEGKGTVIGIVRGRGTEAASPPPIPMGGKATSIDTAAILAEFGLPSAKWHVTEWRGGLNKVARCRSLGEANAFIAWAIGICRAQGVHVEYFRHVKALAVEWDQGKRGEVWGAA